VCDSESGDSGAICDACANQLENPRGLCLEHIVWMGDQPQPCMTALIDQWGRPHYLRDGTAIGREPEDGITVLESSVSRLHATLHLTGKVWQVRDLGSSNGTMVGRAAVTAEPAALTSGDKLVLGDVAMYFVQHERLLSDVQVGGWSTSPRPSRLGAQLEEVAIRMASASEPGGGTIELRGAVVHVSTIQFELVRALVDAMLAEASKPHAVRGFVSSAFLLKTLPWSATFPVDNNLKQLVRRVRRALTAAGVGSVIESRQGAGYRLQFIPRIRSH
jgi:hypothetical protein